jgi:hypothetical protein
VNARRFLVYCEADGNCVVKCEGAGDAAHFSDILAALDHVRGQCPADADSATVTVYDTTGRLMFEEKV